MKKPVGQLIRINEQGAARVLSGAPGMIFVVENWVGVNNRCAAVLDYRYPNENHVGGYQCWTIAPEGFEIIREAPATATEETSARVASLASRGLHDPASLSPEDIQSVCASALTQRSEPPTSGDMILVPLTVDYDKVANAFIGVIESGYSPWLHSFQPAGDDLSRSLRRALQLNDRIWYAEASYWRDGGAAVLKFDRAEDDEGTGKGEITLSKAEITLGLALMGHKAPKHFSDLVNETDDAITHDVFAQFCVLGDIIYG